LRDANADKPGFGLQAAIIYAEKAGYTEKNLGRQANLSMAETMPEEKPTWTRGVVLPGKPYHVDFVMAPNAVAEGRIVDEKGKPLPDTVLNLLGDASPPGYGIRQSAKTDGEGRFRFDAVPPGFPWWFQRGTSRTQPVTFAPGRTYKVELRSSQDGSLEVVSVKDAQGKDVAEKVVGDDPRARPFVDAPTEAKVREILGRVAEVNRFWFTGPSITSKDITGFSYTFHLTGQKPQEITYQDYLKGQSWYPEWYGKGVSYTGAARVLASLRDQAKFRELKSDEKQISIYFVLQDLPSMVASGNGIAGTWRGFAQEMMKEGWIVLDAKRLTPVSIEFDGNKEQYGDYAEIRAGAYVPLSIDIERGDMQFHWKFRVWKPGFWLFDKTQDRPAADAREPVAWTNNVTVNGQPAVAAENK
jgi:hypothetical protein